jgi:hypothetical protein
LPLTGFHVSVIVAGAENDATALVRLGMVGAEHCAAAARPTKGFAAREIP